MGGCLDFAPKSLPHLKGRQMRGEGLGLPWREAVLFSVFLSSFFWKEGLRVPKR